MDLTQEGIMDLDSQGDAGTYGHLVRVDTQTRTVLKLVHRWWVSRSWL